MNRRKFLQLGTAAAVTPALTKVTAEEAGYSMAAGSMRHIGVCAVPSMNYGSCISLKDYDFTLLPKED